MSQICFYLDEDTINAALVKALRNANLNVVTVADAGRLGYPDEEQLIWATEQGRVIYSFNITVLVILRFYIFSNPFELKVYGQFRS